jgi:hydroxysqualene dehydroxylase
MTTPRIAVIGAGWAGIAATLALADAQCAPHLIEAARHIGGRARRVDWMREGQAALALDNGQHILIGAYSATLALMRRVGVDPARVLKRVPLSLASSAGFRFVAPVLPAPWHLLGALVGARGLSLASRWSMTRLLTGARLSGWRVDNDGPLLAWLSAHGQSSQLIESLWAPLCVAALNTPVAIASTRVFLNVLRDSLGAAASDSDLLLPCRPLDELLPLPAHEALVERGASVTLGVRATGLRLEAESIVVNTSAGASEHYNGVVLATPAHQVEALLADPTLNSLAGLARDCSAFTWQPITTVYLRYARHQPLALPMLALVENAAREEFGQWIFDKQVLGGTQGVYAVVISAQGAHQQLSQDALVGAVERQLARQLGLNARAADARVITEKRATFACVPHLVRPANRTAVRGIVLAGDYTASDYPATLEAAIRSGEAAARTLLVDLA